MMPTEHLQTSWYGPKRSSKSSNGKSIKTRQQRPTDDEQDTVQQIRAWHAAGWTLRKIAGELNRLGVATKNGGAAWYASTVRRIVMNRLHMVTP